MTHGLSKVRFEAVFRQGKRAQGKFLRLFALPGNEGIGVGTVKALGCHARRNRQKRRAREAARQLGLDQQTELDYVILVSQRAFEATLEELYKDLAGLVGELKKRWEQE